MTLVWVQCPHGPGGRLPCSQIYIWRLARDILNITCNFLYCNHQVHRDFLSPCILVIIYRRFGTTYLTLFFKGQAVQEIYFSTVWWWKFLGPKDKGNTVLRNVGNCIVIITASLSKNTNFCRHRCEHLQFRTSNFCSWFITFVAFSLSLSHRDS
jgi:hypothetical protein